MTEVQINIQTLKEMLNAQTYPTAPSGTFDGIAPLNMAQKNHISFLTNEKYKDEACQSQAGVILCDKNMFDFLKDRTNSILMICDNAYASFAKVSQVFFKPQHPFAGLSPMAMVDQTAEIHPSATIFPFVFIGPGVKIGAETVIYSGCFIGAGSEIGKQCLLYPNVVVREGCLIGDRCLFNPGAVIGGDGFGFAPTPTENVKIPQIGGVEIASDVEVGANSTIDRGALSNTKIGSQTKIDNLVMVAHNVVIGDLCFIAGQSGIAGSTSIGNKVVMAGQVGVAGHIKIGDNTTFTAQTGVSKNIEAAGVWSGSPAKPYKEYAIGLALMGKMTKEHMRKKP